MTESFTVAQAARILRYSVSDVADAVRRGRLSARKLDCGTLIFARCELIAYCIAYGIRRV